MEPPRAPTGGLGDFYIGSEGHKGGGIYAHPHFFNYELYGSFKPSAWIIFPWNWIAKILHSPVGFDKLQSFVCILIQPSPVNLVSISVLCRVPKWELYSQSFVYKTLSLLCLPENMSQVSTWICVSQILDCPNKCLSAWIFSEIFLGWR